LTCLVKTGVVEVPFVFSDYKSDYFELVLDHS
jgi:hypothetical protein